jgi:hypothetical protein
MFDRLQNEILNNIVDHLCYIDIINLRLVNKFLHNVIILPNIRNMIISHLIKYTPQANELIDIVDKYNCVILSPYIKTVIYPKRYLYDGIDICHKIFLSNKKQLYQMLDELKSILGHIRVKNHHCFKTKYFDFTIFSFHINVYKSASYQQYCDIKYSYQNKKLILE